MPYDMQLLWEDNNRVLDGTSRMEQLIDQYALCDSNMFSLFSMTAECEEVAVTALC